MISFFNKTAMKDSQYVEPFLMSIYDETEQTHSLYEVEHGSRLGAREKNTIYEKLIEEVKEAEPGPEAEKDLRRLYHLVLGNLYLRKGQCEDELFLNSEGTYKAAVKLLREYANPDVREQRDIINLLTHLCLGKYFRSLGHSAGWSNFSLSIHEFKKVTGWLEAGEEKLGRQQTWIWLDAQLNIGRAMKNLYDLKRAKNFFIRMVMELQEKVSGNRNYILEEWEKILAEEEESGQKSRIYDRMEENPDIFHSFFIKALMQLALVYRKQRKYEEAEELCGIVRQMDSENVEAMNSLGVCYRKDKKYDKAIGVFKPLMKNGNRYAEINYWKCVLRQIEDGKATPDAAEEEIVNFLNREEPDRELKLLQGRFLQVRGKMKKAYRVFHELYEKYPYIDHGTIGLKAYYNMATCLMKKEKYQQARRMMEEILKVCENDRLARIDLGWCMMKMNQHISAQKVYQQILGIKPDATIDDLEQWKDDSNLSDYEKVRQLNNMGECYLHVKHIEEAKCMFKKVLGLEKENIRARNFLAQCFMLKGEELEDEKKYKKALEAYEDAIANLRTAIHDSEKPGVGGGGDIPLASNLIIAQAAYMRIVDGRPQKTDEEDKKSREYRTYLESSLLYYLDTVYSQKACFEIAQFLIEGEKTREEEEIRTFYRAFSRIKLWHKEEGYEAFSRFMDAHDIMCLGASKRGSILARLIRIYGEVIRLKEECRYSPDASCDKVQIPVHYTSLEVLKKLVPKQQGKKESKGRMRLWNSVYMNDPYEGACFLDLLQSGCEKQQAQDILSKYFPHLNNDEKNLAPVNSNIYITSLSNQKDELLMWVTYADKARGCNIVFADDFFDIRSRIEGPLGSPVYSDWDYPLYQVQYIDEKELREGRIKLVSWEKENGQEDSRKNGAEPAGEEAAEAEKDKEKAGRIGKSVRNIWNDIKELQEWLEKNKAQESELDPEPDMGSGHNSNKQKKDQGIKETSRNAVYSFVADALSEVRFLFKYSEYAQEEEMRLVRRSYDPQFDENFAIPRMYTEVDREIQIEEVKLGAKIGPEEADEVVSWLHATGRVKKVTKSGKHYK